MACLQARNILDEGNGSIAVEVLSESDIEGLVTRPFDRSVKDTFQTEFVALERGYRFVEELFGMLVTSVNTRDIDLFPFDGYIVRFKNCLDSFGDLGSDTVTC